MARIFYLCAANRTPTGGNKIAYRHVGILRKLGFDAYIVHPGEGFRYQAINHNPPVISLAELRLSRDDIVVLPEDVGPGLCSFARGARKVLFNQNAYNSFIGFDDLEGPLPPYLDPEYEATLVVSEDNLDYIRYAFPGVRCLRIRLSLDFTVFSWVPASQKRDQIAFMTRKNRADIVQVVQVLRSRGALRNWQLKPIENQDEAGVSRLMGDAKIFLAFGYPEGISLSNLEAMARGCRVIGYSGMGCREYFTDDLCLEVPIGDVIAFARAVEMEIARFDAMSPALVASLDASRRYVHESYSPESECADLLAFYNDLLGTCS